MTAALHTIVETPRFLRDAERAAVSDEERKTIVDAIAANPGQGDEVQGSGGVRKVRVAGRGKGKSGAVPRYGGVSRRGRAGLPAGRSEQGRPRELQRGGDRRHAGSHHSDQAGMAGMETAMSDLGSRIMEGLGEALEHAKGNDLPGLVVHVPASIDVVAVRKRAGLSQDAFARRIGVSLGTLRNWEQGRRGPEGPARVLLAMLERNPRVVEETLGKVA